MLIADPLFYVIDEAEAMLLRASRTLASNRFQLEAAI
jgi:hypothetical protein